jgi:hypothetical protein
LDGFLNAVSKQELGNESLILETKLQLGFVNIEVDFEIFI